MQEVVPVTRQLAVAELAGPHRRDALVRHDLDAGGSEIAEQPPAAAVDLAADRVDDQPNLDAFRDLGGERRQKLAADVAFLVAVDQEVDMVPGGPDVLEHAREIASAVQQRLDGRRHGRCEAHREIAAPDPRLGKQRRGTSTGLRRGDAGAGGRPGEAAARLEPGCDSERANRRGRRQGDPAHATSSTNRRLGHGDVPPVRATERRDPPSSCDRTDYAAFGRAT